ncbi:hypothetical protein CTAYLR_010712 [Chrysophaeum taylorii]|uniref:Serine aminopeptidase S33 domain-containing protein n=1 Tax=Chrysophaeum taylorii TaxID=2483200 RepID=A0AAD7UF15_9STRA|nr:hypothetical protein CTAYLR_010712 [Chrysophaeum taylorii]
MERVFVVGKQVFRIARRRLSDDASCAAAPIVHKPPVSDATTERQRMDFVGADGQKLAGLLELPKLFEKPKGVALFAHCFTCGRDVMSAKYISGALTRNGFACLRFDFTGLGHSDGEWANTNFSSNVADLLAAADHLRGTTGAPQILVGHSLGGAAVLAAAPKVVECKAIAVVGAPFDPAHVLHNFEADLSRIEEYGQAEVKLAGRTFKVKKQFLDDIRAQDTDHIASLRRALLVLHAPADETVALENAAQIFWAAKHPKSFISLDGATHLLSNRKDAIYAGDMIATWAERYIG